jgi:ribosomal protein L11 methyltransferase
MTNTRTKDVTQAQAHWYAVNANISSDAREAVEYALMEAKALGTETVELENGRLSVTAFFNHVPDRERIRYEISEALRIYDLPSSSILEMNTSEVPDQDWLAEWKKDWQPVETGRFIIAPPWTELTLPAERIVIRIEPGMAFGTGTHETTRLCLSAVDKYYDGGSFLDVGTGTGILAIAAAKLSPNALINAYDNDPQAIEIARENATLNGVGERIKFHSASIAETTESADFVCANLTADVIENLLPALLAVTCGKLVLSGILNSQVDRIVDQLESLGVHNLIEVANHGEWSAIVV